MGKIIYLEADEEITSLLDRLKAIDDRRVALIIPRNATFCSSVVNLKLLKKNADELKKELFLIASDDSTRNLVQKAGLVAYPKLDKKLLEEGEEEIEEAEKPKSKSDVSMEDIKYRKEKKETESKPTIDDITFRKGKSKKGAFDKKLEVKPRVDQAQRLKKRRRLKLIIVAAVVAMLIITAGASAFLLPAATVSLTLYSQPFQFEESYSLIVDEEDQKIQAEMVSSETEKSGSAKSTGKKNVGKKAAGTITISNLYSTSAQSLSAGTQFKTSSGLVFKTKAAVSVPGYTDPGTGPVAGKADVSAEAADVGDKYNVGAGHFTIPAFAGTSKYSKIYGDSSSAMSGGSSRVATVVSTNDVNKLKSTIEGQLKTTLQEEIQKQLDDNQEFLETAIAYTTISAIPSKEVETEVAKFDMTVKVKASAIVYNKDDLEKQIKKDLEEEIGEDDALIKGDVKNMEKEMTEVDFEKRKSELVVSLVSEIAPVIDQKILKDNIAGRSVNDAEKYLGEYEEIADAKVRITPSWWWIKSIPSMKSKIHIKLDYIPVEEPEQPAGTEETEDEETTE